MASAWTAIIPVKPLDRAKSRLGPTTMSAVSAYAFFRDALAAVEQCSAIARIVVATRDPVVAGWAAEHGADVFDDTGVDGINAATAETARSLGIDGPVAIIVSDLPCLTAPALGVVLEAAAGHRRSFVRDAAGTGTTVWLSTDGTVASRFGVDSAAAHTADGGVDLAAIVDGDSIAAARRDVDTAADLAVARTLGVGVHTAGLLTEPRVVTVAREAVIDPAVGVPVVDEDGRRLEIPGNALASAGFRLVRVGQRLVVDTDADDSRVTVRLP